MGWLDQYQTIPESERLEACTEVAKYPASLLAGVIVGMARTRVRVDQLLTGLRREVWRYMSNFEVRQQMVGLLLIAIDSHLSLMEDEKFMTLPEAEQQFVFAVTQAAIEYRRATNTPFDSIREMGSEKEEL